MLLIGLNPPRVAIIIRETVWEIDVILGQEKLQGKSETEWDRDSAMEVIVFCRHSKLNLLLCLEAKVQVRSGYGNFRMDGGKIG